MIQGVNKLTAIHIYCFYNEFKYRILDQMEKDFEVLI
jgi:hypothetical protein